MRLMSKPEKLSMTRCPVLYDENGLIVVDKPEGVLSHPNPSKGAKGDQTQTRAAFEGAYDFEERSFQTPEGTIWLIHRLDQDTSGVLVATRTKPMAEKCRKLFEDGQIRKIYTALMTGRVQPATGRWQDAIGTQRQAGRVRSRVMHSGAPNAKLSYRVKHFFPKQGLSLVEIELHTGRTHQIRVQAAYRRHELIGDEIYGNFPLNKKLRREFGLRRLFLHASMIEIQHPATLELLRIESPLPEKLSQTLGALSA